MMENRKNYSKYLNSAGRLARSFIRSKLTLLIIIFSLFFGLLALAYTPRTYNPEIVVPVVNITIIRHGSNASEMLKQIVQPLEALMHSISGVDHTYGMAMNDHAVVTVRFKVNENEESSLVKVYDQINKNMNKMPAGTMLPLIQSVSLYDVPIVTITLSSASENQVSLRRIANQVLLQLRNVPGVGSSEIIGSTPISAKVLLNVKKMRQYHISIDQVSRILRGNNAGMNAGTVDTMTQSIPIRFDGLLTNLRDLKNITIGLYQAKPIFLGEIANIELMPENSDIQSYFAYGKASKTHVTKGELTPAITLAFARKKGSNGVVVAKALLDKFATINFGKNITATVTRDYGLEANNAVNTLVLHLAIAIFSIIIILLLFLGWREASIVIFTIPLILLVVLGVGWIVGQTINRITLFALILSLGLLADDSIVVIENIHRHLRHKVWHNFTRTIIIAANEIGKPTIIATLTVILALVPMAFVTGMMKPFMAPIPFNAPLSMILSLLIAFTVVPYLAYKWLKKKAFQQRRFSRMSDSSQIHLHKTRLQKLYLFLFNPLVNSKWKRSFFYIVVLLLLGVVTMQPLWQFIRPAGPNGPLSSLGVELKMLPDDNVNTFLLEVNAKQGASINQTKEIVTALNSVLKSDAEIKDYQIFYGKAAPLDFAAMVRGDSLKQGSDFAQIRINLINKYNRSIGSHEIAQQLFASLKNIIKHYPDARIKLFETPPGPPVPSQMEAGIYSKNYADSEKLADTVTKNVYPKIYGMINIDNSVINNIPEYLVSVDHAKAAVLGLSPSLISQQIKDFFAGVNAQTLHVEGAHEPINILLKLPKISRSNVSDLKNLFFLNRLNERISLSQIAEINNTIANSPIFTRDQHEIVYVTGEMLKSSPVNAVFAVNELLKNLSLPNDRKLQIINLGFNEAQPKNQGELQFSWLGEMRLTLDVFRDLGSAFIVALVLIYLLLVGFYRFFVIPMIIMGAIPLTIIGVFPGHWLMQQPFTATSMIGVIALAGIVVRNSILLIDFILNQEKVGVDLKVAVIEAAVVRLIPILLTALAIIFGSAIMITDPVFGGLATSLIFGTIASTILTLFVIPLIYFSWKKWVLARRN